MRPVNQRVTSLVCAFIFAGTGLLGQGERGAITGTITDQSGAVMPDVEVSAINLATNVSYSSTSTATGTYRIPSLPPGMYKVAAVKSGFKQVLVNDVRVSVSATVNVDLSLDVGTAAQSVNVEAQAALLQPTAAMSTNVGPKEFQTWPIFTNFDQRQPLSFAFNSLPGAVGDPFTGSVNGGMTFGYEVMLDGIALERNYLSGGNNDFTPNAESVSEFSLQSGNIGASYGGAGTAVANLSIKSGTNSIHGTAFLYNGNSLFTSRGATANAFGLAKGRYNQNNFGATISGPIRKNKTFYFATWEGTRTRSYNPGSFINLPTRAWKSGDFSDQLGSQIGTDVLGRPVYQGEIFDPMTTRTVNGQLVRDPFTYQGRMNVMDPARFSSVSKNILPLIPDPTLPGTRNNYLAVACGGSGCRTKFDQYGFKLDQVWSSKHLMSGYWHWGNHPVDIPVGGLFHDYNNPLNVNHIETDVEYIARFSEDWVVSPRTLNHFGIGYNRINRVQQPLTANQGWASKIGLQGVDPQAHFPVINFSGTRGVSLKNFGDGNFNLHNSGSWIVKDDLTLIRGRHTFQMGFEFRRYFYEFNPDFGGVSGSFNFDQLGTQLPGFSNTGHEFASFLLGAVHTANRSVPGMTPVYLNNYPSFYFQEEMKLTPKLTLTTGLRWEIPRPRHEQNNLTAGLDPNEPNPKADGFKGALVFLADRGQNSFQKPYYREFAPNFGLAYSLSPRMVIRSGYAITYNPPIANGYGYSEAWGLSSSVALNRTDAPNSYDPVLYWDRGMPLFTGTLPSKDPALQNGRFVIYTNPDGLAQGYIQHWNFTIQRLLPRSTVAEVAYVGTRGVRLPQGYTAGGCSRSLGCLWNMVPSQYLALGDTLRENINLHPEIPRPYPSFQGTVNQALRRFPQYSSVGIQEYNVGRSIYHSLQVQARKLPAKGGLGYILAYTFSKAIDDGSGATGYSGLIRGYQDFYNRGSERALSTYNPPHDLKLTWIWELPFGQGRRFLNRSGFLDKIIGGWTLTA